MQVPDIVSCYLTEEAYWPLSTSQQLNTIAQTKVVKCAVHTTLLAVLWSGVMESFTFFFFLKKRILKGIGE